MSTKSPEAPAVGTIWRHYKGKEYQIVAIARHTETLEPLVVYQALYDDKEFGRNAIWARPLSMWYEIVESHGIQTPRFMQIKN